ncbi:hypothetical protein B0H16DRAFT_301389 [Mycena metata]|uniref:VPS37 C-terminal domain-containing protein n=1 Tax=Mycena metata TaxID=1033252 RepID=A0AAD7P232_9AGAR|nr:hypothetical protein B0H16DRAFT_301389 [Mycena metata]
MNTPIKDLCAAGGRTRPVVDLNLIRNFQTFANTHCTMSTPLITDFPELADLSREDLEDLLTDPVYFKAIFHSLDRVRVMYQSQAELGMANESIAKHNLELQEPLYRLRAETKGGLTMRRTWRQGGGVWRGSSGRCISYCCIKDYRKMELCRPRQFTCAH